LHKQNQYHRATPIYQEALTTYRQLAEANPPAYLPDVAMTLNNLAVFYRDIDQLEKAVEMLREMLKIRRELASEAPPDERGGNSSIGGIRF
jgi:tetratricopeptide (TPR) repeat protein